MTQNHSLTINDISIINRYNDIRKYSEKQCRPLKIEDYIPQPVVFISPPKWHLGHTTWFFEEFILKIFYTYDITLTDIKASTDAILYLQLVH